MTERFRARYRQALNHNGRMHAPPYLSSLRLPPLAAGRVGRWWPVGVAFAVWLLVGFSVVYLLLRWFGQAPATQLPVSAGLSVIQGVDTQAVAHALGAPRASAAAAVAASAPSRYALTGVVAPVSGAHSTQTASPSGVALIAVDGQRPSPYRVGAVLDGRWRVHAVERRSVVLHPLQSQGNDTATTLSLPPLQP